MKFSTLQETFARGLAIVQRAAATKNILPITQSVLIVAKEGKVSLKATNLELTITTWIGAQVEEEGEIAVPVKKLADFIKTLPSERVDIKSMPADKLSVICGKVKSQLKGYDASDFPPTHSMEDTKSIKIAPDTLKDAIGKVAFAASTTIDRPVLQAVRIEIKDDMITFAAADGFRLAIYKSTLPEAIDEPMEFNIPAASLMEVERLIGSQEEDVEIGIANNGNAAIFHLGNVELVTQLIVGTFPNYAALTRDTSESRIVVNAKELSQAIQVVRSVAREGTDVVRLTSQDAGLCIVGKNEDEDVEVVVDLIKDDGGNAKVALKCNLVLDALKAFDGEVVMEVESPMMAVMFRPLDDSDYVSVVMPMHVT